jgi:hypothetical protein
MIRRVLQSIILIASLAAPAAATAEPRSTGPTASCVQSHENGQRHRNADQLLKARDELRACSAATCPSLIQDDCATWLMEVTEIVPTVVLSAKVGDQDVFDVAVSMDGQALASQLDGKPIEVDPGLHTFVFESAGRPRREKKVIVAARQRAQAISAAWVAPTQVAVPPTPAAPPPHEYVRPIPPLFYALGATAAVGFGAFAFLGVTGESTKADLNRCSPSCSSQEVSALKTRLILADVAAGVGGAAAAGALVVFLTRPERSRSHASSAIGACPVGPGAVVQYMGTF